MSQLEQHPSPIAISSHLKLKETIVVKHQRAVKICSFDVMPFIDEKTGFVDPDFPHSFSSINDNIHEGGIEWVPAQELSKDIGYSSTILSIQQSMFAKKSIAHALTLLNWFANQSFGEIFLRELSGHRLYVFDVMLDGVFVEMPVDSYVPVDQQTKVEIFSRNYKGSVFPCLYEKLLAKIYGNYYEITQEFIDIVELQTFFCRQELPLTQGIGLPELQSVISTKLEEKSVVCFRTRNSIRLQSFGLHSNHIYVIVRLIIKQGECLVQFLQLQGESWIGKMSKLRSDWLLSERSFMERNSILVDNERVKENYMRLSDLKGIGRELVILNNTYQFHKNYEICQFNPHFVTMYRFKLQQSNKIMIRVNYKHKKCYNSIILVEEQQHKHQLLQSSFQEHKESNYLEATLQPKQYCIIVYNTHPQEHNLTYHLTFFSSQAFVHLNPIASKTDILPVMQSAFKGYFAEIAAHQKQQIIFKQLYNWTGMAFVYLKPTNGNLKLTLRMKALEQSKILALNLRESFGKQECVKEVQNGEEDIVMFRCLWSKKQNIVFEYDSKAEVERISFPPVGSVKVTQTKLR